MQSIHQLISFTLYQNNNNLNNDDTNNFTHIRLMHKSSFIRSVILQYPYNFLNISKSIEASLINDNGFPVLSQMVSCELAILDMDIGDSRSIISILRCMPNLKHFYFHLRIQYPHWIFPDELFNGYVWKQVLELYVPYLSKFEFHMEVIRALPKLALDFIVNSFNYFVGKYSNWHMIIDQWMYDYEHQIEFVMLSTLNYHKRRSMVAVYPVGIDYTSFDTRSTTTTPDNHYLFYTHLKDLTIFVQNKRENITWSSSLFQHITDLVVTTPILNAHDDDKDAQQMVTCLSRMVSLYNVTKLEFRSMFHISIWKHIQYILQACPNVINIIVNTSLLLSPNIIDNASLIPIFKKIKIITSVTENVYFPSNFSLKFVQRFPSLTNIEIQVFSFDHAASIIDIFLTQLEHLSYIKIHYDTDTLLDDHFSCHYIIGKRRQSFSLNYLDEQMINIKNNGKIIEIWL
ncbi:unnamed protein product [Adineta steineri]|uniref:Uncharacterized protein n=1 Tax=Adineta steineri TaxID=433720 RepID=A0A813N6Y2_9BILA|nr:unnamed protein product [Adineta steineri]CAF1093587.1 unnamed protein product [Adineta steineri]